MNMATHDEWNKAIAEYFSNGLPIAASVYLSVDEESLEDIGIQFNLTKSRETSWVDDFINAVHIQLVQSNKIYLNSIINTHQTKLPLSVAFLGAMVLAAYRMMNEESEETIISEINYFRRLRQVLGLPEEEGGRPLGLIPAGVEELLWKQWNQWLLQKGLHPSAERGSGSHKFINYPLSQTLLRAGDKERLEGLFRREERAHKLSRAWDRNRLDSWLRFHGIHYLSKHLRKLLEETEPRRQDAILDAIYEVYTSLNWEQDCITPSLRGSISRRKLIAGLYRIENPITGAINYHLYSRQPRHWQGGKLELIKDGKAYALREERPGWFMPFVQWQENLSGGISYEISGDSQVKEIILPEASFWILVMDPENDGSGILASWGIPGLGERFLLLCRPEYAEQMERLKQAGLVNWADKLLLSDLNNGWIEYRECMILSANWDEVIPHPEQKALCDALRPSASATLAFIGGLRVPHLRAWLEGHVPKVSLIALDSNLMLEVLDLANPEEPIESWIVNDDKPIDLDFLEKGDYVLRAYTGAKVISHQILRILSWESLEAIQPKRNLNVTIGEYALQGAVINQLHK
jgi:hypothetical protein